VARVRALGFDVSEAVPAAPSVEGGPVTFALEGMDCADCARTVEDVVGRLPGVAAARVNFAAATLTVEPEGAPVPAPVVVRAIGAAGYRAVPLGGRVDEGAAAESTEAADARASWLPTWMRQARLVRSGLGALAMLAGYLLEFGFGQELAA